MPTFNTAIQEAIAFFANRGFVSETDLRVWTEKIRQSMANSILPEDMLNEMLARSLGRTYDRMIERGGILKMHGGLAKGSLSRIKPSLRGELDRRIMASANLIKLNREQAIHKTLQRFSGWATSIPAGGSDAVDKRETAADLKKSFKQLSYEERRVSIDQGHKMMAALNEMVAKSNNALAVKWHSQYRQPGYNYRQDHKERDGNVYLLRDSWALERGLIKTGDAGYYDDITAVGEEIFCRCTAVFLYALRDLPVDMLTKKGSEELQAAREKIKAFKERVIK